MSKTDFQKKLEHLINCESLENGSDTPDYMLAEYLVGCLEVYEKTIHQREKWYGRDLWSDKNAAAPLECSTI